MFIKRFLLQNCHDDYRVKIAVSSRRVAEHYDRHNIADFSFAGCFNTNVFKDVLIEDFIIQLVVTVTRLERYASLRELQFFIGQDKPVFYSRSLGQDSARTWLVANDTEAAQFQLDVLDIRGSAHLALQNDQGTVSLEVKEYKGDFTGTLHVGPQHSVDVSQSNNSVIPFTIRTYQVG